jgi:hypothetical protein
MFFTVSRRFEESLLRNSHTSYVISYKSFALVVSEEKILKFSGNQKQKLQMVARFFFDEMKIF